MPNPQLASPKWSANTKLVIGLTFVAAAAALVIRFSNILVPLLFTAMLSYIIHPVASFAERKTRLSWRGSVNLVYLILLIVAIGFLVALGVALVQQLQNLVDVITNFVDDLPNIAENIAQNGLVISFGAWSYDFSQLISQLEIDILALSDQIINVLQPVLGQAGSVLGRLAASTFVTLGWGAFVFVVSYFLLVDASRLPTEIFEVEVPGFAVDFQRMGRELGRIWNAFLRGQLFLFIAAVVGAFILLWALGVNNALGLAFLVGIAKFVPYLGPIVANLSVAIVAFFQPENYLNIEPLYLVIVVVAALMIMDQIFDTLIAPILFGNVLGIHPAAQLITAIILSTLIGLMGIILAAPVLASLQMFGRYVVRKMMDKDPWPDPEEHDVDLPIPFEAPVRAALDRIKAFLRRKKEKKDD
ncbi:MAG: AI-2E family transporter [Anaerolineae bacterium]|nr:AI-2E family transporter [Anaerolineae bacterium]